MAHLGEGQGLGITRRPSGEDELTATISRRQGGPDDDPTVKLSKLDRSAGANSTFGDGQDGEIQQMLDEVDNESRAIRVRPSLHDLAERRSEGEPEGSEDDSAWHDAIDSPSALGEAMSEEMTNSRLDMDRHQARMKRASTASAPSRMVKMRHSSRASYVYAPARKSYEVRRSTDGPGGVSKRESWSSFLSRTAAYLAPSPPLTPTVTVAFIDQVLDTSEPPSRPSSAPPGPVEESEDATVGSMSYMDSILIPFPVMPPKSRLSYNPKTDANFLSASPEVLRKEWKKEQHKMREKLNRERRESQRKEEERMRKESAAKDSIFAVVGGDPQPGRMDDEAFMARRRKSSGAARNSGFSLDPEDRRPLSPTSVASGRTRSRVEEQAFLGRAGVGEDDTYLPPHMRGPSISRSIPHWRSIWSLTSSAGRTQSSKHSGSRRRCCATPAFLGSLALIPPNAWCFVFGFLFPPLWWLGAFWVIRSQDGKKELWGGWRRSNLLRREGQDSSAGVNSISRPSARALEKRPAFISEPGASAPAPEPRALRFVDEEKILEAGSPLTAWPRVPPMYTDPTDRIPGPRKLSEFLSVEVKTRDIDMATENFWARQRSK